MPNFAGIWSIAQQLQAKGESIWTTLPGAPTIGTATATSGSAVSVTFTAPSSTGYPAGITGYTVTSSPGGLTGTGSSSPISVTGLTADTAYTFTVRAVNATGTGPSSAASNSVTPVNTFVEDVFSTYLYTGNGSTQTITNGIDLSTKGGLVWTKDRTSAISNELTDTVRGAGLRLLSNMSSAQGGAGSSDTTSFTTTGFGLTYNNAGGNLTSENYVSWTFRKQPKFFDIVTWTGNGSGSRDVAHSLGAQPGMVITKCTSTTSDWHAFNYTGAQGGNNVYNTALLNSSAAGLGDATLSTVATSTTLRVSFSGAFSDGAHNVNGATYVAYLFANNAGGFGLTDTDNVITCDAIGGDGTRQEINLGWEPQFVLYKIATSTGDWAILDSARGELRAFDNGGQRLYLAPNVTDAEGTYAAPVNPYLTSTGFGSANWGNGNIWIYMAIRRGPMRVPTLGTTVFAPVASAGNSGTAQVSAGFTPDAALIKTRNSTRYLDWFDRIRGNNLILNPSETGAEYSYSGICLFNQIQLGVQLGAFDDVNGAFNYINYFFRRAPGFFDEVSVKAAQNSYGYTISHNLGVVPQLIISKDRDATTAWAVWCSSISSTYTQLVLNTTAAATNGNSMTATSASITTSIAGIATPNQVLYLFASAPGVSKVGSYTGNGTTQTIDCSFTGGARFVLIKRTDSTGDWYVWDTVRGIITANDPHLSLNTALAEVTNDDSIDPASTGFIVNQLAATNINITSATYIFLAIA